MTLGSILADGRSFHLRLSMRLLSYLFLYFIYVVCTSFIRTFSIGSSPCLIQYSNPVQQEGSEVRLWHSQRHKAEIQSAKEMESYLSVEHFLRFEQ